MGPASLALIIGLLLLPHSSDGQTETHPQTSGATQPKSEPMDVRFDNFAVRAISP